MFRIEGQAVISIKALAKGVNRARPDIAKHDAKSGEAQSGETDGGIWLVPPPSSSSAVNAACPAGMTSVEGGVSMRFSREGWSVGDRASRQTALLRVPVATGNHQ
jgi:hypothetical protein